MLKKHGHGVSNRKETARSVNGIDIPTMWIPDTYAYQKTILLLAQDPLRNANYWNINESNHISQENRKEYVIIGTPYALHVTDNTTKSKLRLNVGIYCELIGLLISQFNCRVYCTDIFKYYPNNKLITTFDKDLLIEEINAINPDVCVCMGKLAKKAIEVCEIANKAVYSPHPRAWPRSWDKWRLENNMSELSDYSARAKIENILTLVKRIIE